jgi:hypothetical protein
VNFLRANNIAFINDWPAKSPNLNPIEHLWDSLDQLTGEVFCSVYTLLRFVLTYLRENLFIKTSFKITCMPKYDHLTTYGDCDIRPPRTTYFTFKFLMLSSVYSFM